MASVQIICWGSAKNDKKHGQEIPVHVFLFSSCGLLTDTHFPLSQALAKSSRTETVRELSLQLSVRHVPDVVRIFRHGPVRRENTAAGDVVEAHAVPLHGIGIGIGHAPACLAVGIEIRQQQILVGRAAAGAEHQTLIQVLVADAVPEAGAQGVQAARRRSLWLYSRWGT